MFPKNQTIYNFYKSNNVTRDIISELEALVEYDDFFYFIVPFDWILGFQGPEGSFDLWSRVQKRQIISWGSVAKDSLKFNKVKMLLFKIWDIFIANNKYDTFKEIFFLTHVEHRLEDGYILKSFNSPYNKGRGFYPDGSANYFNYGGGLREDGSWLLLAVSYYQKIFSASIPPTHFQRLATIIKKVKNKNNGDIFFILPPLAPGLEKKLIESQTGSTILTLKNEIHNFGLSNKVQILDAGQSEKYGCKASDFLDAHHAIHTCYEKILPFFFNQRHKVGFGLITREQLK